METSACRKGTLLIVDDEEHIVEGLKNLLEPLVEKVWTAKNGQEALEFLMSSQVDAVLSDIKMPIMSGLETLEIIRSKLNFVPFVIVTSVGDKDSILQALRLNATEFIEKPFDSKKLMDTMEYALALGVAQRELNSDLENLYQDTDLSPEIVAQQKAVKQSIFSMKFVKEFSSRKNKE